MCGLIGVASMTPVGSREWLPVGRDAMAHRGPDDAGLWWSPDGRVGLAHRRLAVIDLSPGGHQPMADASGRVNIVFNGEIYNFQELRRELEDLGATFRTGSDTEVILQSYLAFGTGCLRRLKGMFAFALFDRQTNRILLARDRSGEKPLFYREAPGELRFASELKGLLADPDLPRVVDRTSLDCYLYMGFVPSGRCILQGFNKLPPAHALEFDLRSGQSKLWAYWELPPYDSASDGASEDELLDEVEPLLQDAVRQQMVSDVPLGVLLSGGVDSSIIAAMAVRESPHVKTFTARFPGHGQHDETEHARLVARHLGTEHIELEVTSATADLLPEIAHQVDEPLIDSSLIPTWMLSHLVRQHCTVAVGGDGGDELFGGYGHYSRLLRLEKWTARIPWPMRRVVASSASRLLPPGFRGGNLRSWLMAMGEDLESGLPLVALYFDASLRRQLLARDPRWRPEAEAVHVAAVPNGGDLLQRATRMDFGHYLTEDILVKVDRASMRHSLEVRAPMLDQAVVEFAARRVPSRLKASAHQKKILLKRLTERLLPPEFDRHRKQGFSIPLRQWLKRGPFRDLFESVLFARDSVFDKTTVRSLMRGQDHGRGNEERLFALVMFELWRREYGVSV